MVSGHPSRTFLPYIYPFPETFALPEMPAEHRSPWAARCNLIISLCLVIRFTAKKLHYMLQIRPSQPVDPI